MLVLLALAAAAADRVPLLLPPGELPAAWAAPAALAGLTVGGTLEGAGVELRDEGTRWTVHVRDAEGHEKSASIPAPHTATQREDAVWLAVSLLTALPTPPVLAPIGPLPSTAPSPTARTSTETPRATTTPPSTTRGAAATAPATTRPPTATPTPPVPAAPVPTLARVTPKPPPVTTPAPTTPVATPEPTAVTPAPTTPVTTPEPTAVTTPAPTPVTTPEPTAVTTPEPSPVTTPEPTAVTTPAPTAATPASTPVTTPAASSAPRLRVHPWSRLGPAGAWRPDTTAAYGGELTAGVELADVWLGVGASLLTPRELRTEVDDARLSAVDAVAGVWWSPTDRPLAPMLGASAGLSFRWYSQEDEPVADFYVVRFSAEAGLAARLSAALALVPAARFDVDAHTTRLTLPDGAVEIASPVQLGGALTLRARIP